MPANLWPFVPARDFLSLPAFGQPGCRKITTIVIHDMEAVESDSTAENVARYFQHPDYPSSAHICVDNNSIVQCVLDKDVAYAAPGANHDGIQIELAGFGKQSSAEWLDHYGLHLLANAADVVAQYCTKFGIPAVHLTNAQLADGKTKGIIGHYQASAVFKKSDHTDPGGGFPWQYFVASVQNLLTARAAA